MSSRSKASSSRSTSKRTKTKTRIEPDPAVDEYNALCKATEAVLQKTIASDVHFSDLPPDCTLEELQAEIALAKGQATTVYVKRDGLSTLKVVLPQQNPTIANLKRAIERTANLLQQRKIKSSSSASRHDLDHDKSSSDTPPRRISNDGALIAAPRSGRKHRSNPSWRFLWRAYCLTEAQAHSNHTEHTTSPLNQPLPDTNGRQLLSDFGIGHKSVLRFVKRENYFGRQRQRS